MKKYLLFPLILFFSAIPYLHALDIEKIGSYGGAFLDVKVSGKYAFVANVNELKVFDVSEPSSPVLVKEVAIQGNAAYACKVFVLGEMAYIANGREGFIIVDISSPSSPNMIGSFHTDGFVSDIFVSEDRAYVAEGSEGLKVVDVSDPSSPVLLGSYAGGDISFVIGNGNYVYAAGSGGLMVMDVTNPSAITKIGSYICGLASGISFNDNTIYLAVSGSLLIIDVLDGTNPILLVSYKYIKRFEGIFSDSSTGYIENVYVSGKYAYLWVSMTTSTPPIEVVVVDITAPSVPLLFISGGIETDYTGNDYGKAAIFMAGNYLYMTNGIDTLMIFDCSFKDVSALGSYKDEKSADDIFVSGNVAYQITSESSIRTIDVSDPSSMKFLGKISIGVKDVVFQNNKAYVASGYSGLKIIDFSDPSSPKLTATYHITYPEYANYVSISGNLVCLEIFRNNGDSNSSGFMIFDVSDPSSPLLLGSYIETSTPEYHYMIRDVYISGDKVYVADVNLGLQVFDISQPSAPVLERTVDSEDIFLEKILGVAGNKVWLYGKYQAKYSSDYSNKVFSYDLTNTEYSGRKFIYTVDSTVDSMAKLSGNIKYFSESVMIDVEEDENYSVKVVDVQSAKNISIVHTGKNVSGAFVSGDMLFLAQGSEGITAIDISEAKNNAKLPKFKGSYVSEELSGINGMAISGNIAYLKKYSYKNYYSDYADFIIVDISNPSIPKQISSLNSWVLSYYAGNSGEIYLLGNNEVLSGLSRIDISDPENPYFPDSSTIVLLSSGVCGLTDSYSLNDVVYSDKGIFLSRNYAQPVMNGYECDFTWEESDGIEILSNQLEADSYYTIGNIDSIGYSSGIYTADSLLYICDSEAGLRVADVKDIENPKVLGSYNTSSAPRDVFVVGSIAYVIESGNLLEMVTMSDPSNMSIISSTELPGSPSYITVSGGYAYVSHGESFSVIDVNGPFSPDVLKTFNVGYAGEIYVDGDIIYINSNSYGLKIFRLTGLDDCSPEINGTGVFDCNGGEGAIAVSAPQGCQWTALLGPGADGWIEITSGSSGSGNGEIKYTVAKNNESLLRTGSIFVGNKAYTVKQATCSIPKIKSVNKKQIYCNNKSLVIKGINFGDEKGTVNLSGKGETNKCTVLSWSDTKIKITIPCRKKSGKCVLDIDRVDAVKTIKGKNLIYKQKKV